MKTLLIKSYNLIRYGFNGLLIFSGGSILLSAYSVYSQLPWDQMGLSGSIGYFVILTVASSLVIKGIMNILKLLGFQFFDISAYANHSTVFNREQLLDTIEEHGYEAHFYLPSVGHQENQDLADALNRLGSSGYIITEKNGCLVGKVVKCRLSSDEIARQKRAEFKLID